MLFALILWQAVAMGISITREIVFPTPYMTFLKFISLISGASLLDHSLFEHTKDSLFRWMTGYFIAFFMGLTIGFFSTWNKIFNRIILPQVYVIQMIPGLAWIPVALLIFGVGPKATIFMVTITAFTPIVISTAAGIKGVDENYIRAAKMLGATPGILFFKVLLPGSMPHILSGLRIAMANGWRVLVAGEMVVGSGTGLGYAINPAGHWITLPHLFVWVQFVF
jgi:ABC-type nitrate/sulfonate/bicarbonate transport system permease component